MDTGSTIGKVIALNSRDAEMAHPLITTVSRYWDNLRAGRVVPQREEIDPREIQNALSYSFILDRSRPGSVRFRLSGMHLNDVLGMEARGMPVRALCDVPHRQHFMEQVEQVFEMPAILEADLHAIRDDGAVRARLALLPLSTFNGVVNRALGIFVCDSRVVNPPLRFAPRSFTMTPLTAGVSAFESRRALMPSGFAEEEAIFQPQRHVPIRRTEGPQLRVVDGGKP